MAASRKVMVAIDASDQAEYAFHWYLTTVHRPDNEVVLVHVPDEDGDKVKELEEKFHGKILENGISGRIVSGSGGKPGEVICRVAEEEDVTMVVLGTRGLGKVRRTIMGSVSDYVVHHAHCPVIVCRQGN